MWAWVFASFKEISQIPRYRFLIPLAPVMPIIGIFAVFFSFIGYANPLVLISRRFLVSEIKLANLPSPRRLAWEKNTLAIAG